MNLFLLLTRALKVPRKVPVVVPRFMRALAALLLVSSARAESEEGSCRSLGFAPSLLCSSCVKLGEFVAADDPLLAECNGCCTEDISHSGVIYSKAILDVCR